MSYSHEDSAVEHVAHCQGSQGCDGDGLSCLACMDSGRQAGHIGQPRSFSTSSQLTFYWVTSTHWYHTSLEAPTPDELLYSQKGVNQPSPDG